MSTTIEILMNHMSIRKYKDIPIDEETKKLIIHCGQMAPTSSHYQTYTIIEVKDKKKKDTLFEISGGQQWIKDAPLVLLFCADLNRSKKYFDNIDESVLSNTESYTIAVVDTALVLQKSFIAAQSLGLGGVIVGGIRNNVERLSKEFELPNLVAPICLLCLGYPDEEPGIKPRLPQEEIYKVDFYDDSEQHKFIDSYNETIKKYYIERTNGKSDDTWSKRSGERLMAKSRESVGTFFRKIGFLKR